MLAFYSRCHETIRHSPSATDTTSTSSPSIKHPAVYSLENLRSAGRNGGRAIPGLRLDVVRPNEALESAPKGKNDDSHCRQGRGHQHRSPAIVPLRFHAFVKYGQHKDREKDGNRRRPCRAELRRCLGNVI